MTRTPLHRTDRTLSARARALELVGAYTADVGPDERRATLQRVVDEVAGDAEAVRVLVHALTEYAATFADVAAAATLTDENALHPATLVRALARLDLTAG